VLHSATAALLAKAPRDPQRILAHAQSENRLALLANSQGRLDEALQRFERTRRLLSSIAEWGRDRAEWLRFAAFANGNICATIIARGDAEAAALGYCSRAVSFNERLVGRQPDDRTATYDLVFHLLWMAEAQFAAGQAGAAERTQKRYLDLIDALVKAQPRNMLVLEQQMQLYSSHARLLRAHGQPDSARAFEHKARRISRTLVARDPGNAVWVAYEKKLSQPLSRSR
jgi:tetratricopeptide (TPR) repeat protein